jgi:hypothetical protein
MQFRGNIVTDSYRVRRVGSVVAHTLVGLQTRMSLSPGSVLGCVVLVRAKIDVFACDWEVGIGVLALCNHGLG